MKKALSLLLVLVLALSMSTVAFAADDRVTTFDDAADVWGAPDGLDIDVGVLSPIHNDFIESGDANTDYVTAPNVVFVPVATSGINGTSGVAVASTGLTEKAIKAAKVTVEIKASKGGQYLDEAKFAYKTYAGMHAKIVNGVEIVMVDEFASNNPDGVEFIYRVYLSIKKSIKSDGTSTYKDGLIVKGEFKNAEDFIEDEDFYEFFDGRILRPEKFVKNLEGWLDEDGDGVLHMRALKGAKYWAMGSHDDWTEKDDAITEKYPEIDGVYHINQRGLTNVVANVEFPNYDPTYYVYTPDGETLKYVGRAGANNLPLLDTYYFSVSELDVDEFEPEDDEDGDDDWDYDENEETGGDDLYPSNPHDNPGTGR